MTRREARAKALLDYCDRWRTDRNWVFWRFAQDRISFDAAQLFHALRFR